MQSRLNFAAVVLSTLLVLGASGGTAAGGDVSHPSAVEREALAELARHDVVWNSPGLDSAGSMPLGNGEFGGNVWMDGAGDLLILLSRVDSFSECERLLKLGRVRISCTPPLDLSHFTQRHSPGRGVIEIAAGRDAEATSLRIFVAAGEPVMHVTIESATPRTIRATLENWRDVERRLEGGELKSAWIMRDAPPEVEVRESADVIVPIEREPAALVWYHRNDFSVVPFTLRHQGLEEFAEHFGDPLLGRTFGARVDGRSGEGESNASAAWTREGTSVLQSPSPLSQASLTITSGCAQTPSADAWLEAMARAAGSASSAQDALRRTEAWWADRFTRSWLFVDEPKQGSPRGGASLSQAYAAQRFATLAATGGSVPVKFNGSIFTVEPKPVNGAEFNPDFRNWGGDFWWQNTRLPYHGMLARGDGDHLDSLFSFYLKALPGCTARARHYHGVDGAYFPETMTIFATYSNGDYGWNRAGVPINEVQCPYWQWAWNQGPELVAMMLDHWDYTGDERVLREQTLPVAAAVLAYFDSRFARDERGILRITPTQSAETYWTGVINDLPTVAGLREVTARLCALPTAFGTGDERALWERLRAACPAIPLEAASEGGELRLSPAETYDPVRSNCENPELYAVWPFQLAGLERGLYDEARRAFDTRRDRFTNGWPQDGMQAARLGLADEAAANVLAKVANTHKAFRYPTFWGPNFDWVPDQCHGGNLLTTMQEMLLQPVGGKILVLPAWPRAWNARFRLHAPARTVVTGEVRDGALVALEVDPPARAADVVLGEGWELPR